MWTNPQETSDLVIFTKEILNVKLHFLCSAKYVPAFRFLKGIFLRGTFHKYFKYKLVFRFLDVWMAYHSKYNYCSLKLSHVPQIKVWSTWKRLRKTLCIHKSFMKLQKGRSSISVCSEISKGSIMRASWLNLEDTKCVSMILALLLNVD